MITPSDHQDSSSDAASVGAGRRLFWTWLGWGWLVLLVGGIAFLDYKLRPRDALDLGENSFVYVMLCLPLLGAVVVTVSVWLSIGIWRLWKRRPGCWLAWVRLAILMVAVVAAGQGRKLMPPFNPITPESEPQYLAIAALARAKLSDNDVLFFDPHYAENTKALDVLKPQFDRLIPAYWPRRFLYVRLEGDSVVLERGTGMLGDVGVRIYDRGRPASSSSNEDVKKDPMLLREERITDRLWYFRADD